VQASSFFGCYYRFSFDSKQLQGPPARGQGLRIDAVYILAVGFIAGLIVGRAVWGFQ